MKIDLYTLCWNEMKIIPFVIDYWKNIKNQIENPNKIIIKISYFFLF